MKIAVSTWNTRIAPVFDSAEVLNVYEYDVIHPLPVKIMSLKRTASGFAEIIVSEKINAVICGAVSRESVNIMMKGGVKLYSFLSGEISEVLAACQNGTLSDGRYAMPGCGCVKKQCRRQNGRGWKHCGDNKKV